MGEADNLPVRRLRDYLRRDAAAREASACRYLAAVALAVTPMALLLGPVIGWPLSRLLVAIFVPFAGYQLAMLGLIRRGNFRPAIAWINVFLETSIPLAIISVDLRVRGPEYALTSPPIVIWAALIMLSVLRASRTLCLAAGALAAVEYLVFYFGFAHPRLTEPALLTLTPAFIAIRAFLLACAGAAGAIVAHHLLRKAEEALSAVRAQDLMSKYLLHEQLGAGGMAEVFRATYCPEGGFERVVAIKRVLPTHSNDPHFTELFRFEAQVCARLSHPNIVQVTDIGRFDGNYVLAMEFVDGLPLSQLLRRLTRPLPVAAVAYFGAELAAALDYLHGRKGDDGRPLELVHRDVNPPNVLLSRIGEVKLADFGVAHAAHREERSVPGVIVGKPSYLSPEQARGAHLDGRSDLFCLGLTLWEALTGLKALYGPSREAIIASVFQPLPPPSSQRAEVPPALDLLIADLLQQDPARRPPTGREVRARLMALDGPAAPYPLGHDALSRAVEEVLGPRPDAGALTRVRQKALFVEEATEESDPARTQAK